ncbi:hypothetical protein JCM19236_3805 [Vibrio sp. JCM 19236]|nr:hypothetical protein JCM19236_3805 [Vibrio sp. JCM 19236]
MKHGSQNETEEIRVELVGLLKATTQYNREVIVEGVSRFILNDETYDLISEAS